MRGEGHRGGGVEGLGWVGGGESLWALSIQATLHWNWPRITPTRPSRLSGWLLGTGNGGEGSESSPFADLKPGARCTRGEFLAPCYPLLRFHGPCLPLGTSCSTQSPNVPPSLSLAALAFHPEAPEMWLHRPWPRGLKAARGKGALVPWGTGCIV